MKDKTIKLWDCTMLEQLSLEFNSYDYPGVYLVLNGVNFSNAVTNIRWEHYADQGLKGWDADIALSIRELRKINIYPEFVKEWMPYEVDIEIGIGGEIFKSRCLIISSFEAINSFTYNLSLKSVGELKKC